MKKNLNYYKSSSLYSNWYKLLLTMKIIVFLFFLGLINLAANPTYSQNTKISLNMKGASIEEVLTKIEDVSEFFFLFNQKLIDVERKVDVVAEEEPIKDILSGIFGNYVKVIFSDRQIVLTPAQGSSVLGEALLQQKAITGKITDSQTGESMPGVNVVVPGTTIGVITDINGIYTIEIPNDSVTLQFSFVGYVTQEIVLSGRITLNVGLTSDVAQLSEVVVIGYGTALKKDLTGSVSNISPKRLLDKPSFNVGQALQGKIAGVQVIQQGGGVPGANPMIRIRGTNAINTNSDPLFVVDGIVGVSNALSTLNPEDILSLDVLKDASATAIYGARGANGVISITTKRGINGKTQVDYNSYISVGALQRHNYTLDADQFMYVYEQSMANGDKYGKPNRAQDFRGGYGTGLTYSEMPWLFKQVPKGSYVLNLIGKDGNDYAPRFNTDWESQAFRPSLSNNQHIDVRGGNENAKYSLSLGYSNQQGLMEESFIKRYTNRITGDIKIFKWLDLSTQLSFNKSRTTNDGGITRSAAEVWSILPVKYPNNPDTYDKFAGRWGTNLDFGVGEQWYNIKFLRSENSGFTDISQTTENIALNVKITENLSFKSDFAIDFSALKHNAYSGKLYEFDGTADINTSSTFYWQNQNYFNYKKTVGENHTINGMIGIAWSQYSWENLDAENKLFISNFYQWHNLEAGAAPRPSLSSSDGKSSLNSYFARINYSYKSKYMLTMTGRFDGSSKFGANSKYGFFPSAGVAWRVSNEDFLKNVDAISDLKLRASIGQTGNQEIGSYVTQTFMGSEVLIFGGEAPVGIYPSTAGNSELKWETTTQYDAGINFGLWKSRASLEVDYYYKVTKDMLLDVPLPESTTVGIIKANYGSVENKGWEFTLITNNITTQKFNWNTNVSISTNRNNIIQLGPTGAPIYVSNGASVYREGAPIGSFFGLTRLGTYSTEEASLAARYGMLPGDLKYQDTNMDGKIDLISDGDIIGRAFPKLVMGFNNYFTYKNFDAGIDVRIVGGVNKVFFHSSAEDRQLVSGGLNTTLEAWRPDHQNTMVAQVRPGLNGCYYQTYDDTHMIYDASYIRGASATLGYSFSNDLINRIGLQKIRIYLNATNFFLITKAAGYDPEGSSLDMNYQNVPNTDKYQYPNPAVFTFGINVGF